MNKRKARGQSLLRQIPESLLARLWKNRSASSGPYVTRDGRLVKVLYPGRPGTDAGPDFRDALLEQDGRLVKGDVEVHRRQGDWQGHGHHRDPRYDGVVLHAVLRPHDTSSTALSNGKHVPVVELGPLLAPPSSPPEEDSGVWSLLAKLGFPTPKDHQEVATLLDCAGERRFLGKSQALLQVMEDDDPQEVLYQSLLEALGYSKNRQPFLELASRMPYRVVVHGARRTPIGDRVAVVEGLLQRAAGFTPGENEGGPPLLWHLFRVRPGNHPRRRIAGAARLLNRYLGTGLLEGLQSLVLEGSWRDLERGLTVGSDGHGKVALIGAGRARDMAVNVVTPFFHALGLWAGGKMLPERCLTLYRSYPPLQENELTREMLGQLVPEDWRCMVNSACRQQGLIHLYRAMTHFETCEGL